MASAWIEVFKTGTHTSGNGVTKTYGDDDLDNMAKLYNDQKEHTAPLVLGHPATDDPAFGWAKELKKAGDKLLAYVDEVSDDIVKAVKDGAYKKVSIALYPDGLLRHIGLLGATPPAVKGLGAVQFAEGMEFEEYLMSPDAGNDSMVSKILSGIKNLFNIEALQDAVKLTLNSSNNYSEIQTQEEIEMEGLKAKIAELEDQLKTQSEAHSAQFSELTTKLTELATLVTTQVKEEAEQKKTSVFETVKAEFAAFCETLCKDGKMLPAEKDSVIEEYADLLKAEETMTFAEGDTKLTDKMKARLEKREAIFKTDSATFADPDKVAPQKKLNGLPAEFAACAGKVDTLSMDMDQQIRAYAEEHKCSYVEAAEQYGSAKK
jgi:hypothetical protein